MGQQPPRGSPSPSRRSTQGITLDTARTRAGVLFASCLSFFALAWRLFHVLPSSPLPPPTDGALRLRHLPTLHPRPSRFVCVLASPEHLFMAFFLWFSQRTYICIYISVWRCGRHIRWQCCRCLGASMCKGVSLCLASPPCFSFWFLVFYAK